MFKNYLKIAVRNLLRSKIYSIINIVGLAVGIVCCLLIYLFIRNEMSYDHFHSDGKRIFRVLRTSFSDGNERKIAVTSGPYADALMNDFPAEVKEVVRVYPNNGLVVYGDKAFREEKFYFADSNFFSFFSFPLLKGDPSKVLQEPNSVVISYKVVQKYFGNENPLGKLITVDKEFTFTVTGVFGKFPGNSHLDFDFVASLELFKNYNFFSNWWANTFLTYAKLPASNLKKPLEAKFDQFMEKYLGKDFQRTGIKTGLTLEPLDDIYFNSGTSYDWALHGDKDAIYIFSAIAIFILLIACINFLNLSTARSDKRVKEIGLRKVVGALRHNLIIQFLAEAMVITSLATLLALFFIELSLPFFESFLGDKLIVPSSYTVIAYLPGIIAVVGILAGGYPAFILSGFRPIKILKSQLTGNPKSSLLREGLVVTQFSISILMIISTIIIFNQMDFIRNKKLGFNINQVLLLRINNADIYKNRQSFKENLLKYPEIKNVSVMSGEPGGFFDVFSFKVEEKTDDAFRMRTVFTDFDYVKTLRLKIIAGRDFSEDFSTDKSEAVLLNESAVKYLGWNDQNAIGKRLMNNFIDSSYRKVVGIVEDFHFKSLREKIEPLVISISNDTRVIAVKINSAGISHSLGIIKEAFEEAAPQYPFEYEFLDKSFDNMYKNDEERFQLFTTFSILAIFIACLGLLGLSSFTSEQRRKEIGIRKVLGATVSGIVLLLSKEFIRLVLIANLIAWPLAYYFMNDWLEDFAYKIEMNIWNFVVASGIALLIALATICYQAFKAATANPVKSLRYE